MARSKKKKVLVAISVAVGGFVLLIYACGVFLYVGIKKRVIETLSSSLGRPVEYQSYTLNPLGSLRMTGFKAGPALSIDEVEVGFDPFELVREKKIASLDARGVFLDVDSLMAGLRAKTTAKAPGSGRPGKPNFPVFSIERARVREARVRVAGAEYSAALVDAKAVSRPDTMSFTGSVFQAKSPYSDPDSVSLCVKLHEDGVSVLDISGVEAGRVRVTGASVMVLPQREVVEIRIPSGRFGPGVSVDSVRVRFLYGKKMVRVSGARVAWDTLSVERVSGLLDLSRDSIVVLRRGFFYFGDNPVRLRASLRTDSAMSWDLQVSFPRGLWVPDRELFIAGQIRGQGRGAHIARLDLDIDSVSYRGQALGAISGELEVFEWKRFSSPGLAIRGPSLIGTVWGWVSLGGDFDVDFSLRRARLELLGRGLRGSARGEGTAERRARRLFFRGKLDLADCSWRDIGLERASLDATVIRDTVEGWVVARDLTRGDLRLDSLRLEGAIRGGRGGFTFFTRTRDSWLSSEGTVSLSDSGGSLSVTRLALNLRGLGAVNADGLTLKWRAGEVSFSLPRGEMFFGLISVGGRIRGDSLAVALAVDSADMRALSSSLGMKDTLDGVISVYATVAGSLARPEISNLSLFARGLRWGFLDVESGYGEARFVGDTLFVDSLKLAAGDDTLWLSLRTEFGLSFVPFRFEVDTSRPLSGIILVNGGLLPLMGLFEKFVAFEGTRARGEVQIYNTLGHPYLSGKVDFSSPSGVVVPTGTVLSDIESQISFQGDVLSLHHLRARAEKGDVNVDGTIGYQDGAFPMDLRVQLSHFPIYPDPFVEAWITGNLAVGGSFVRPEITGALGVDEASFYAPLGRKPAPKAPEKPSTVKYDIRVHADRNVFFVNELADLEMSADLTISKEPGAAQTLAGQLDVVSGYLYFFDRTFKVDEGSFMLSHQATLDPLVNIRAVDEITDEEGTRYKVYLMLSGKLSAPDISLSSEPPLSQGELVSLVTLGTKGGAPEYSQVGERAMNLAEGFISKELRKKINLTELEVRTGAFGGGAQFSVGMYLTRNLYAKYSRDLNEASSDYYLLKYFIKSNVAIYGEKDETGVGVGFQYRFRF